jgi:transposase InsO family protein
MTENEKQNVAIFRFSVIHEFVGGIELGRGEQERLIEEKCSRKWDIPYSGRTRISRSAILRWIRVYKESGGQLGSLYPKDRSDRGRSRAIDEETGLNLIHLRTEIPKATVPVLIQTMKNRGLLPPGKDLKKTTVYRFLHAHNLMNPAIGQAEDRRKFEAELPNDIWQSDVMHGPMVTAGDRKRKTYLIAFIDDHSRLIPYGRFYLSEKLTSFLDAFEKALLKRGMPRKLYVDNGAAYRSKHLEHITASLGIALIHARPYKPQGKGNGKLGIMESRYLNTLRVHCHNCIIPLFSQVSLSIIFSLICLYSSASSSVLYCFAIPAFYPILCYYYFFPELFFSFLHQFWRKFQLSEYLHGQGNPVYK